ncbi:MAG: hypothetical protein LBB63_01055 [Holosporaceae bacterium]|nr:hypothetical protein [Holosporaceae bacterium]
MKKILMMIFLLQCGTHVCGSSEFNVRSDVELLFFRKVANNDVIGVKIYLDETRVRDLDDLHEAFVVSGGLVLTMNKSAYKRVALTLKTDDETKIFEYRDEDSLSKIKEDLLTCGSSGVITGVKWLYDDR